MGDLSVRDALRSDAPLVVIEAPAGCGKTHQGADYAKDVVSKANSDCLLVLTHTHSACSVFSDRAIGNIRKRMDIRTIDSFIGAIAGAYHSGLALPADTASWIRQTNDGHSLIAIKVAALLHNRPMIAASLVSRHPVIICDEHQDSSGDQHAVVMALLRQGARVRLFGDPMQKIFKDKTLPGAAPSQQWEDVVAAANVYEALDTPHRWKNACLQLGLWTLKARESLKSGGRIDLRRGLPPSVTVHYRENEAQKNLDYRLSGADRRDIDTFEKAQTSLLILSRHNQTSKALRSHFNRRITLWEGHTRNALEKLAESLSSKPNDATSLAVAVVRFLDEVCKGFSPSAFGDRFQREVAERCSKQSRGKPASIQNLARCIVNDPDHRGVEKMLTLLSFYIESNADFADVKVDCHREFWDAIRLGRFDTVERGLTEISHHRTFSRPKPHDRSISTIHKAKGLECESVLLIPCDSKTFPDNEDSRCLLYVALTRAKSKLVLVVSRKNPSPLLLI